MNLYVWHLSSIVIVAVAKSIEEARAEAYGQAGDFYADEVARREPDVMAAPCSFSVLT